MDGTPVLHHNVKIGGVERGKGIDELILSIMGMFTDPIVLVPTITSMNTWISSENIRVVEKFIHPMCPSTIYSINALAMCEEMALG